MIYIVSVHQSLGRVPHSVSFPEACCHLKDVKGELSAMVSVFLSFSFVFALLFPFFFFSKVTDSHILDLAFAI